MLRPRGGTGLAQNKTTAAGRKLTLPGNATLRAAEEGSISSQRTHPGIGTVLTWGLHVYPHTPMTDQRRTLVGRGS